MSWDGRVTKARRRWAAYTTTAGPTTDDQWTTIGGYDTPFPGFAATDIDGAGVWTYALGVITATVDCWIEVGFYGEMTNNATGRRGARIAMDGVDNDGVNAANFQAAVAAGPMRLEARYVGPLAAGHTLTVQTFQDSGGSLSLTWRQLIIDGTAL